MKSRKSLIIFCDAKENILIQDRRTIKKPSKPYGFFGGSIEEGETPEQALKREIQEELTLTLTRFKLMKKIVLKNPEVEMEWHIFLAPIPDLGKVVVEEGQLFLTTIEEALKLDISERDVQLLRDLRHWLKNQTI